MKLAAYVGATPQKGTLPLKVLVSDLSEIFDSLSLYVNFARQLDRQQQIAAEALLPDETDEEKIVKYHSILNSEKGVAIQKLQDLSRYNNRIVYQVAYNAFTRYLSDLIKLIFEKHPEALKTNDAVKFKEIFQFDSLSALRSYMIDKKINELSFMGIDRLNEDLSSRLGFRLFHNPRRTRTIKKIAEKRNAIVHNGGIANSRYMQLSGDKRARFGERVFIVNGTSLMIYLLQVAIDIDLRAVAQFRLNEENFVNG